MNVIESYIREARGEFTEYDAQMEKFFPTAWNNIKGNMQFMFPIATGRLAKEEAFVKKHIKNVDIEIRVNSMSGRNAWTIPGISGVGGVQISMITLVNLFYFCPKSIQQMNKSDLLMTIHSDPNKKIVMFPAMKGKKMKILIFVTKGLLTHLEPEERLAVYLHEIGHWAYVAKSFGAWANKAIQAVVTPYFGWINGLVAIYLYRSAEYASDTFAKAAGLSDELSSALNKITIDVRRKKVSWLIRLSDSVLKFMVKIHNVIDKINRRMLKKLLSL